MADLPMVRPKSGSVARKNYEAIETPDIALKRLQVRRQELKSRVVGTMQSIEDYKQGKIVELEANLMELRQELTLIEVDITDLQNGKTITIP